MNRPPAGGDPSVRIRLDLALVHYPVRNRDGDTIGAAVTNLDLHDIARAGRTYGVDSLYIVTPYRDQRRLVREIVDHWLTGPGGDRNRDRKEALSLVRLCPDLETLHVEVAEKWRQRPTVLATCARRQQEEWSYGTVRHALLAGRPFLILFGTAWGMASEILTGADGVLAPIRGRGGYNHLSVRSAASIVLDRLLGEHQ